MRKEVKLDSEILHGVEFEELLKILTNEYNLIYNRSQDGKVIIHITIETQIYNHEIKPQ